MPDLKIKSKFFNQEDVVEVADKDIQNILKADKDIISQIVVEHDDVNQKTYLKFPEGILPIGGYVLTDSIEDDIYFDYINDVVLNSMGEPISNSNITQFNKNIAIGFPGEVEFDFEECCFDYILFTGSYYQRMNTYYLFFPRKVIEWAPYGTIEDVLGLDSNGQLVRETTSGGTKLYSHSIQIEANNQTYMCCIISTRSASYEISGEVVNFSPGGNVVTAVVNGQINNNFEWDTENGEVTISGSTYSITDVVEAVTEL